MRTILHVFVISRGEKTEKFTLLQGPRQCPHVLLIKVGWKQGKALGSEQNSVLGSGFWMYLTADRG